MILRLKYATLTGTRYDMLFSIAVDGDQRQLRTVARPFFKATLRMGKRKRSTLQG